MAILRLPRCLSAKQRTCLPVLELCNVHLGRNFAAGGGKTGAQPQSRRYMPGAPEIYFDKAIDNSRLVKLADPAAAARDAEYLRAALVVLFLLVMVYVCQHFSSIDYGYKIEILRVGARDVEPKPTVR